MTTCYCGNVASYEKCCKPIHDNHSLPIHPEQLMRARYSAHVLGLVDFVIATYHPSCQAERQRTEIEQSINSNWCGLEVVEAQSGSHADEGFVHFKAYCTQDNQQFYLEERSRFIKQDGLWFYIDGQFPEQYQQSKIGRNDPCWCGSGKKFKKCCA